MDVWTESRLADLSEHQIEQFKDIVIDDVKGKPLSAEKITILKNNLELWLYCLTISRREIEVQLSKHKVSIEEKISGKDTYSQDISVEDFIMAAKKWRSNALKFLMNIEKKTLYVKMILEEEAALEDEQ